MITSHQCFAHFDIIETLSGRSAMVQQLVLLFGKTTPEEAAIVSYMALGGLHPSYAGKTFNMSEKSIVHVIATMVGLDQSELTTLFHQAGDWGTVFFDAIQKKQHHNQGISLIDVYHDLGALEDIKGNGAQAIREAHLIALLRRVDAVTGKYIIRIVVGNVRLGFSDMTILEALSVLCAGNKDSKKQIEQRYNVCADIGRIAYTIVQYGVAGLDTIVIQPGTPIRPAAAERLPSADAIIQKIGAAVAQPKLDGFRLQVHIKKEDGVCYIKFFSRHLQDMSAMFPDLLQALASISVTSFIGEGEAIGYDQETGSFMPFQETVKRRRKHDIAKATEEFPLQIFMFDMLYVNGHDCMHLPHEERRAMLKKVMMDADRTRVKVVDEIVVNNASHLESYFLENIAEGLEGVMVKRPDALYQPGKRNFNWIKLKRQEEGHIEDSLDLVVLGYYAGAGKRARFGIGAFLVGTYNDVADTYETIAKIGTGLTDQEWINLKKMCDALQVNHRMPRVMCAKELEPDVWVEPRVVVMVRADEITLSPLHTAGHSKERKGYALRFPRFMGYREDKGPEEATTSHEVSRMFHDQYHQKK